MKLFTKIAAISVIAFTSIAAQAEVKPFITMCEVTKSLPSVEKINVDTKFCRISVKQTDSETTISGKLEAMVEENGYAINIDEANNECNVTVSVPQNGNTSFAGEIEIAINKNVELNINTTSGFVDFNDLTNCNVTTTTIQGKINVKNCTGQMNITTKNGAITIDNIDGNMSFESSTGNITADKVNGNISFDTPDGAFTLSNAKGEFKCGTIAGTQTYSNINGILTCKGSSGAIKISSLSGTLNISTMNGAVNLYDIKADLHIATTKGLITGSKYITLTGSSDFNTVEGKVNLRLQNTKDELTFNLSSENSKASLIAKGTSKNKKLNIGKGNIVITGHSKTGSQIFY